MESSTQHAVIALRADRLGKHFGARAALRDVSFTLARGQRLAILGPNGAGKTTLLSLLAGLQQPTAGSLSVVPQQVGWVPQQTAVYRKLSVGENLRLFARLEGVPDVDGAVGRALQLTGLAERARDELGTLSGGNQQRVNIAIGLLASPEVLVLDEPSASLDPRQRTVLWRFLDDLADGGTSVLFSTHDVGEARRHSDRVLVLAEGTVLFDGTVEALQAQGGHDDLEDAFVALLEGAGR